MNYEKLAEETGFKTGRGSYCLNVSGTDENLRRFADLVCAAERERLCAAIKAADDKASESDYMLDSDDCIAVIRGTWDPGS